MEENKVNFSEEDERQKLEKDKTVEDKKEAAVFAKAIMHITKNKLKDLFFTSDKLEDLSRY